MHTFEMTDDQVTHIVVSELVSAYRDLQNYIGKSASVFSHDPVEDDELIQRHIDALSTVLTYYGAVPG